VKPPLLVFSGASGSGKTTLLVKLIPALRARGLAVAALKHSGHRHAFDRPGKDSARLRAAGAVAVALAGPAEVAYFGPPVRGLAALAALLPPCDLVLAEGFKGERAPRVEVHREVIDRAFLCARDRSVVAVVSDVPPPRPLPWFTAGDVDALADFVAAFTVGHRPAPPPLARSTDGDHRSPRVEVHPRENGMAKSTTRKSGGSRGRKTAARRTTARKAGGTAKRGAASKRGAARGRRTVRSTEFFSRIGKKGGKASASSRRGAGARKKSAAGARGGRKGAARSRKGAARGRKSR
jgi:molybdopterin-guanine dinucleotide biosynthesis protein B